MYMGGNTYIVILGPKAFRNPAETRPETANKAYRILLHLDKHQKTGIFKSLMSLMLT